MPRRPTQIGEQQDFQLAVAATTDLDESNALYEREERRQQILALANAADVR